MYHKVKTIYILVTRPTRFNLLTGLTWQVKLSLVPAKNSVKVYLENGYYHIYNRGVEKRSVFMDNQDYLVFLHFLKRYLLPPPQLPNKVQPGWKSNLYNQINLIAYCLLPNHFHLMIKQFGKNTIAEFMRALSNSYIRYFNEKHDRVGPLFQGTYRAVLVDDDSYLLHLTRYIHLNPLEILEVKPGKRLNLVEYPYSSYPDYLDKRQTEWVHPNEILENFKRIQPINPKDMLSYQNFVENYSLDVSGTIDPLRID